MIGNKSRDKLLPIKLNTSSNIIFYWISENIYFWDVGTLWVEEREEEILKPESDSNMAQIYIFLIIFFNYKKNSICLSKHIRVCMYKVQGRCRKLNYRSLNN